jgi:hypothetical protein
MGYYTIRYEDYGKELVNSIRELGFKVDIFPEKDCPSLRRIRIISYFPNLKEQLKAQIKLRLLFEEYEKNNLKSYNDWKIKNGVK